LHNGPETFRVEDSRKGNSVLIISAKGGKKRRQDDDTRSLL
jgi:hypothetical protein